MVSTFLFGLIALIMVLAALVAVTNRNLVRATMGLVLVLFGNAVLFVLLEAYFLAMAQIIIIAGGLGGALLFWMVRWPGGQNTPAGQVDPNYVQALGQALVNPQGYVVPFEVASVLLLAALIGAIYVAWGGRRVKGPYPQRAEGGER